jgi:1-acyl-sn-glycerol-3-phosphate acyltransferase
LRYASRFVSPVVKAALKVLCRVDSRELDRVPETGPFIVVINHINFLEVPMLYAFLYPRDVMGLVKAETWKNPAIRVLAETWSAIPLDRSSTDLGAMRSALGALKRGKILAIAPEGTRSGDGRLGRAHAGVVSIAVRSGVPIVPVAHFGGERFWENLRSFKKTQFHFRVGEPFTLSRPAGGLTKSARQKMADEIMGRLAALLPERYRGVYADEP